MVNSTVEALLGREGVSFTASLLPSEEDKQPPVDHKPGAERSTLRKLSKIQTRKYWLSSERKKSEGEKEMRKN